MENQDHILIFRTNITALCKNCEMHKTLQSHTGIQQWNIDHEDVDCVLRIVSDSLSPQNIITIINRYGFDCSELE
ncbi:MAG TPA: hypothetical protein VK623_09360 [Flavobacterium sp.]|nr:hypothetical protein [Flavobacterium sp.]